MSPRGHDEDEDEPVPPHVTGHVEVVDDDHDPHPAAWLYLPDITSTTGWASHKVPRITSERAPKRLGFGR